MFELRQCYSIILRLVVLLPVSLLLFLTLLRLLLIELFVVGAITGHNRTLEGVVLHVAHQS